MQHPASISPRRVAPALAIGLAAAALGAPGCAGPDAACAMDPERCASPAVQIAAVTPILSNDQVSRPRDLAFNPRRPDELWVVNAETNSVTIVFHATDPASMRVEQRRDRNHAHFMAGPSSLAFGADQTNDDAINPALAPGTFATCQESRNGGNDFMGPVLWSSDLSVFAVRNGTLGSHLDMLHQSPQCMGIAWAGAGNVYWAFNGLTGAIDKYDFQRDHGVGNDNHDDGIVWRYIVGQVKAVARVPSHLAYRAADQMLYIADTGNARVVKLATTSGARAGAIVPQQDEAESWHMTDAQVSEVVPRSSGQVTLPSGLEIHDDRLYVSDAGSGLIHKLTLDGVLLASLQTDAEPGGLAGLAFGPDQRLYFTDQVGNRVLRLTAPF